MNALRRLVIGMGADARVALRRLAASRSSTAVAIAVLGLAIGVGAAVFSVVDAVALRDLPFRDPGGFMAVLEIGPGQATRSWATPRHRPASTGEGGRPRSKPWRAPDACPSTS